MGCRDQGWDPQEAGDLDLLRWQLCQKKGRPPNAGPSPPTPDPERALGLELKSGSPQASHFPSVSLLPFCGLRTTIGGSEDTASLGKFPSCGHWGDGGENGWQGQREGRNYSGLLSPPHPRTRAQMANDHPVCQAKMFPVLAAARLNLSGAHRKLFPEASAFWPPWN